MDIKKDPNIETLEKIAKKLGDLTSGMVVVGGCTTGLHITDDTAPAVRKTEDVDLITDVTTRGFHKLSEELKKVGFKEDISGPICRYKSGGLLLDVMPINSKAIGVTGRWYKMAYENAEKTKLPSGKEVSVIRAPEFLACKLDAFSDRGDGDFLMSKDIQDIIAVIDGRPEIVDEVENSPKALRGYLGEQFKSIITNSDFRNNLPGHLNAESQDRIPIIMARIERMSMIEAGKGVKNKRSEKKSLSLTETRDSGDKIQK